MTQEQWEGLASQTVKAILTLGGWVSVKGDVTVAHVEDDPKEEAFLVFPSSEGRVCVLLAHVLGVRSLRKTKGV